MPLITDHPYRAIWKFETSTLFILALLLIQVSNFYITQCIMYNIKVIFRVWDSPGKCGQLKITKSFNIVKHTEQCLECKVSHISWCYQFMDVLNFISKSFYHLILGSINLVIPSFASQSKNISNCRDLILIWLC
jgi:hypothetical protein